MVDQTVSVPREKVCSLGCRIVLVYLSCLLTPIDIFIVQSCLVYERFVIPIVVLDVLHTLSLYIYASSCYFDWILLAIDYMILAILATNQQNCHIVSINLVKYLGLIRLCKIKGIRKDFHILQNYLTDCNAQIMWKNILNCCYYFILFTLIVATLSCLWFWIACYDGIEYCVHRNNWVSNDSILQTNSSFSILVRSAYFITQTLYTIGYGDIHPMICEEFIFACIVMVIAVTFNGLLISFISSLFRNSNLAYILYQQEVHLMKEILKGNPLPEAAARQLFSYKKHLYQKQLGISEHTLCNKLPNKLRSLMKGFVLRHHLQCQPLLNSFGGVEEEVIVENAEMCSVPKGFCFSRAGAFPSSIVILRSGYVFGKETDNVLQENDKKKSEIRLGSSDTIADYEMVFHKPMQLTYRAQCYCEAAFLSPIFVEKLLEDSEYVDKKEIYYSSSIENDDSDKDIPLTRENASSLNILPFQHLKVSFKFFPHILMNKHKTLMARVNPSSAHVSLSVIGTSLPIVNRRTPVNTKSQFSLLSNLSKSIISFERLSKNGSYFSLPTRSKLYEQSISTLNTNQKSDDSSRVISSFLQSNFLLKCLGYFHVDYKLNYSDELNFCIKWNCFLLAILIYNSIVTMSRVTTDVKMKQFDFRLIIDYFFDACLLVNITNVLNKKSIRHIHINDSKLCQNVSLNAVLYLILVLPFDILSSIFPVCLLRLNKLLSIYFIAQTLTEVRYLSFKIVSKSQQQVYADNLSKVSFFEKLFIFLRKFLWEKSMEDTLTLFEQSIWTFIFLSWFTLWWDAIHNFDGMKRKDKLLSSLYWCLTTVTTTGYGDIVSESTYESMLCLSNMYFGPLIFASAIAYLITFGQSSNVNLHWFHYRETVTKAILFNQSKCTDCEELVENQNQFGFMDSAFAKREEWLFEVGVPKMLKGWIRENLLLSLVKSISIFKNCSENFLLEIIMHMEQCHYCSNEVISDQDGYLYGLYLIKSGCVVVSNEQLITGKKYRGESFGEMCLFQRCEFGQVNSVVNTELWYLSHEKFSIIQSNIYYLKDIELINLNIKCENDSQQQTISKISQPPSLGWQLSSFFQSLQWYQSDLSQRKTVSCEVNSRSSEKAFVGRDMKVLLVWNTVIALCALYQFFIVPYRVGFPYNMEKHWWRLLPDYICDVIFVINIIFHIFGVAKDRLENSRLWEILYCYRSSYVLHLIAVIPTDLLFVALRNESSTFTKLQLLSLLRMNRLAYLHDLWYIAKHFFEIFSTRKTMSKIVECLVLMVFCAHLCGCSFMFIARVENQNGQESWASNIGIICDGTQDARFSDYVVSIYWAITALTTVGYGDIVPISYFEKIFNIVLFIIGTTLFASIIGSFQSLTTENNYILDRHLETIRKIESLFKREVIKEDFDTIKADSRKSNRRKSIFSSLISEKAPFSSTTWQRSVQSNMRHYYQKLWKYNMGEANEIMAKIFTPINSSTRETKYTKVVRNFIDADVEKMILFSSHSTLFKISSAFKNAVFNLCTFQFFSPNQILFYQGEISDKLYFVVEGEVCLTNDQERLSRGSMCFTKTQLTSPLSSARTCTSTREDFALPSSISIDGNFPQSPTERSVKSSVQSVHRFTAGSTHRHRPSSKRKAVHYRIVKAGLVSEGEFFLREVYSCHGQAVTHCRILVIEYSDFIRCLQEHGLLMYYHTAIKTNCLQLRRRSTHMLVNHVNENVHNPKMKHMMSLTLPIGNFSNIRDFKALIFVWDRIGKRFLKWTFDHPLVLIFWNNWFFGLLVILLLQLPIMIAFPNNQMNFQCSIVLDVLWCLSVVLDLYWKLFFAECELSSSVNDMHVETSELHPPAANASDGISSVDELQRTMNEQILYLRRNKIWVIFEIFICFPLFVLCFDTRKILYSVLRFLYGFHMYRGFQLSSFFLHTIGLHLTYYMQHFFGCIILLLYSVHIIACGWIVLGHFEMEFSETSWIKENNMCDSFTLYALSIYWSMYTITSVGYGSVAVVTVAERIYAATVMMIGTIFTAYYSAILGSAVNYYFIHQNNSEISLEEATKHYLNQRSEVPQSFQEKLGNYFRYLHNTLDRVDDFESFQLIPAPLRRDWILPFATELFSYQLLHDKRINQIQHKGFLYYLLKHMKPYIAIPDEILLQYNHDYKIYLEEKENLFILRRGKILANCNGIERLLKPKEILNFASVITEFSGINQYSINILSVELSSDTNSLIGFQKKYCDTELSESDDSSRSNLESSLVVNLISRRMKPSEVNISLLETSCESAIFIAQETLPCVLHAADAVQLEVLCCHNERNERNETNFRIASGWFSLKNHWEEHINPPISSKQPPCHNVPVRSKSPPKPHNLHRGSKICPIEEYDNISEDILGIDTAAAIPFMGEVDVDLFDDNAAVVGSIKLHWEVSTTKSTCCTRVQNEKTSPSYRSTYIVSDREEQANAELEEEKLSESFFSSTSALAHENSMSIGDQETKESETIPVPANHSTSHTSKHPNSLSKTTLTVKSIDYSHLLFIAAAERIKIEECYRSILFRKTEDKLRMLRLFDEEIIAASKNHID